MIIIIIIVSYRQATHLIITIIWSREKKEVPFSMAIEKWELMQERFPKYSRM